MSVGELQLAEILQSGQLRLFSPGEFQRMLTGGVIPPGENVVLDGGLVCIPNGRFPRPRRFSIEEYHRLAEIGVLGPDERVELIDGVVYAMSPIGRNHAACVDALTRLLVEAVGRRFQVRVQGPIQLAPDSFEFEPDLVLLKSREDRYWNHMPEGADICLVIEVMETSVLRDRGQKLVAYAKGGVREVWLVDLNDERVDIHVEPKRGNYTRVHTHTRGETIESTTVPGLALAVDDFLG